jgi:hypothetical protein
MNVSGAGAQVPAAQPGSRAETVLPGETAPVIDVSLDRIRRQLRETPPTKDASQSSLLKLEYYIQVIGTPPPIDFFKDFHIGRTSTIRYGGMTHDEFLRVTAPFWRRTWW